MFRKALTIEDVPRLDNLAFFAGRENSLTMTDEAKFESFYNEHARPLWSYVCRVANNAAIADDIVQESFLRFLGASIKTDVNEKAYLYRIATNLTYDYFRRNSRETKRQTSFASNANMEDAYEQFAPDSGMAIVFDKLKMQERALLWLAYVEGYDHAEIAEMLGLKVLSVRVLLFRARRKLASLLETNNFGVKNYD